MKGITFGSLHSYNDLNLILSSKEMGSPTVKVKKIDIEGADSDLDLTDFFGEPKYENVTHKFKFSTMVPQSEFLTLFSTVKNALHGKKMRIILDDDPQFYYVGRLFVSSFTNEKNIGIVSVESDCEPYKYKLARTGQLVSMAGNNLINLANAVISPNGTWTKTETGYSYQQGETATGSYAYFNVLLAGGKTYTPSITRASTGTATNLIVYSDRIYGTSVARGTDALTFTPEKTGFYIVALITNSGTVSEEFSDVMLSEGSTVAPYEAYQNVDEATVSAFIENSRMHSVPDIYSTDDVTITNGEDTLVINAGETKTIPEFELKEGSNQFNITGTGVVVFDWQEGEL